MVEEIGVLEALKPKGHPNMLEINAAIICHIDKLSSSLSWLDFLLSDSESPAGLVLEFEMWRHFDTKQKSKSITSGYSVWFWSQYLELALMCSRRANPRTMLQWCAN